MPYTRIWSALAPSPNRPANQIDDTLRELRTDIQERGNTLLTGIGAWTSDPVVTASQTYYEFLHWSIFREASTNWMYGVTAGVGGGFWDTLYTHGARVIGSFTLTLYAPIILPATSTIVDIDASCVTTTSTSLAFTVYVTDSSTTTPTRTSLATRTISGVTAQGNFSLSSGANINRVVDHTKDELYWVELVMTNSNIGSANFGFQGLRITYTRNPMRYV